MSIDTIRWQIIHRTVDTIGQIKFKKLIGDQNN